MEKQNISFKEQNLVSTIKHVEGGVMIWECMAASGVSQLTFINLTLDHNGYLNT